MLLLVFALLRLVMLYDGDADVDVVVTVTITEAVFVDFVPMDWRFGVTVVVIWITYVFYFGAIYVLDVEANLWF